MSAGNKDTPLYEEIDKEPYAKVTSTGEERKEYQVKGVWEFKINEFMESVIPINYFKTTGEAIQKISKLKSDLLKQVAKAEQLRSTLTKLRGQNVYLETQWNDGRLLLKVKNPRKAKPGITDGPTDGPEE